MFTQGEKMQLNINKNKSSKLAHNFKQKPAMKVSVWLKLHIDWTFWAFSRCSPAKGQGSRASRWPKWGQS